MRLQERGIAGIDDQHAHRGGTLPTPLWSDANVEPGPERRIFAERSASFIGFTLLGGRLVERAGAFGQVLLIAAVLGSTTRADLYFIASIVPLTIGNVVGEAFAAAVPPAGREGRRARGDAALLGWALARRTRPRRPYRRLPGRGCLLRPAGDSGRYRQPAPVDRLRTGRRLLRPRRLLRCAAPPLRALRLAGLARGGRHGRRARAHRRRGGVGRRRRVDRPRRLERLRRRAAPAGDRDRLDRAHVDLRTARPLGDPRGPLALAQALGVRRQRRYRRPGLRPDRGRRRRLASARSPRSRTPAASRTRRPFWARRSAWASIRASCELTPPRHSTMSATASSRDSA